MLNTKIDSTNFLTQTTKFYYYIIHLFFNIIFTKITIRDNIQLGLWPKKMFHLSKYLAKDPIFKKKTCKFKTILLLSIHLFWNTHCTNITIRDIIPKQNHNSFCNVNQHHCLNLFYSKKSKTKPFRGPFLITFTMLFRFGPGAMLKQH